MFSARPFSVAKNGPSSKIIAFTFCGNLAPRYAVISAPDECPEIIVFSPIFS